MGSNLGCQKPVQKFITYYQKTVKSVVAENLSVVAATGIDGSYTNHPAESSNALLKRHTGRNKPACEAVSSLKTMIATQSQDLIKGFAGLSQRFFKKTELQSEDDLPCGSQQAGPSE